MAQAKQSEFEARSVSLTNLRTRFTTWWGKLDLDALFAASDYLRDHAFLFRRGAFLSAHLMAPGEERLAAELHVSGGSAWERLHSNFTSQISVPITLQGENKTLPMSEIRNLAHDPDETTRERAYQAELAAWEAAALPIAAALNGVKGEAGTLIHRRQWSSPIDQAVFQNHLDRQTLDAMLAAATESFPMFRRYLQAKAKLLGKSALPWCDLFAPVGEPGRTWSYDDAQEFIVLHFNGFSPKLGGLAERAFRERWIDAPPRPGKIGGAYCAPLRGEESRVLTNYSPSYNAVSTLAHELGHAYHNLALAHRTALQRETPSTLAETASTFCETIIRHAALREVSIPEELAILEGSLQDSTQVVVDISSRFLFEREVFSQRRDRELSIDELNGIMLDAQRQTYGEGLAQDRLHPYMWAVKSHYYSVREGFYNFPYMFGLLFWIGSLL